jgi:L-malate glycosyltransferase
VVGMNKKLKIVFFADAGVEHTIRWVKYFAKIGHEVHVISWNDFSKGSASYRLDDIKGSFYPAKLHVLGGERPETKVAYFLWLLSLVFGIRGLVKKIQPDLLHSHSVGAHAWITLFLPEIKSVMTPWGTDVLIDMKTSRINRLISIKALKKSTSITVDAAHMKQELVDFGINPSKINVIYFGTDTEFYARSQDDRLRIRNKYGFKDDDVVAISTRTLNPIHDVFLTLKAIPRALERNKNLKFIIASDGSERQEMEDYVSTHDLNNHVVFPGYMTMGEMVAFLSASDIYVSSSKADAGLSASTAEAMSVGLPVLVSDNSENSFWVRGSGILFKDGDANGISDGITLLANDVQLMKELGSNGRARITKDNDYTTEMTKVNALYLSLCNDVE